MPIVGLGIDTVEVQRIERLLAEHPERFEERCFTPDEAAYCKASRTRRAEHFAARFAAKEACLKALGTGLSAGLSWKEIEVVRDDAGRPILRLAGCAAQAAMERGVKHWHLSLSHTAANAIAIVIAEA